MENLTFVKGSRDPENLDPVSAAILEVASTVSTASGPATRWASLPRTLENFRRLENGPASYGFLRDLEFV